MKEKIKNNLSYVLCAGIGLLNFILFAFNYVKGYMLGEEAGVSGYKMMSMWEFGFGGVMSSIVQISIFILGIILLILGVIGILKVFSVAKNVPDEVGGKSFSKICEFGLFLVALLNVILLFFMIIMVISSNEFGEVMGIKFSIGVFLSIIITVGTFVVLKVFNKKAIATNTDKKPEEKEDVKSIDDVVPKA